LAVTYLSQTVINMPMCQCQQMPMIWMFLMKERRVSAPDKGILFY